MYYDLIVLGGGTAGLTLAHRAAAAGWKVALTEERQLGGTCVNIGCIPTKTLIHTAKILHYLKNSTTFGIEVEKVNVDFPKVMARKDAVVTGMRDSHYKAVAASADLTLFEGRAAFISPTEISINNEILHSERTVIATGARNFIPDLTNLATTPYLTSTEALQLKELPKSLVIIGGGPIAVEFAQMFSRFGVQVTILELAPQILAMLDPDIAQVINKTLLDEGITIKTAVKIINLQENATGIIVTATVNEKVINFTAEKLMLAVGRKPNTDLLNLESAGVATDFKGYIKIDNEFRTNIPGIWAIGDVRGGQMFTNTAWHDGFLLAKHLLASKDISIGGRLVPYAIFTDPEIAAVGLTESGANELGYAVQTSTFPFEYVGRAKAINERSGIIKLVAEETTSRVLGMQIIGPNAAEIIHEAVMGIRLGAYIHDFQDMLHIHPTLAEGINSVALSWHFREEK